MTLLIFIICFSCSTEKDTFLNKAYHNTTAKFNGYFNANEIIKEAMLQYKLGKKENYNEILPVFHYANKEESKALYPAMDTAVAKCEVVISRHSMPSEKIRANRNTEWCKWIDDNWITIGWAQFYKRDFEGAMEKFKYIENQYYTQSIYYDAIYWKAKTLIEIEDYITAEEILLELIKKKEEFDELTEENKSSLKQKLLENKKQGKKKKKKKVKTIEIDPVEFPKKLLRDIYSSLADLYIRNNEKLKAIEFLEKAIDVKQKRETKTRLIFILAQLHHEIGDKKASDLYAEVVKRNPNYEMAFQAKIKRALSFSGDDNKSIINQLLKMLKDDKNIEFFDQIYYALADIYLRENNRKQGIEYLELSVNSSTKNNLQKTKSFIRLAGLYYDENNYRKAHYYYDSTMAVISKDHEKYSDINSKNKTLVELVDYLDLIQEKDSILNLCKLPEKELIGVINKIIDEKIEQQIKDIEAQENIANTFTSQNESQSNVGNLFIWDSKLRGVGFNDFRSFWGTRSLEDNWRRSEKSSVITEDSKKTLKEDSIQKASLTVDYYLSQLPCDKQEQLQIIQDTLMKSLYETGIIYIHKLNNKPKAIKIFTRLTEEFLPKPLAVAALYQLYLIYKADKNFTLANKCKNNILDNYPKSEFAKLILDPNYLKKQENLFKTQKKEYALIYSLFENENYYKTIQQVKPKLNDSTNSCFCKYSYINAISYGKLYARTDSLFAFENALAHTVNNCKNTPYYSYTRNTLDNIRNSLSIESAKDGGSSFIYDSKQVHSFVVYYPEKSGNINQGKNKISNFNKASFSTKGYKTSNSFLNEKDQFILVKHFKSMAEVMDYYLAFKVNKIQVKDIKEKHQFFVITEKNLSALYLEKNLEEYIKFFNKNYLNL